MFDLVQKHFVSATNVSQFAQPKKHHGQQCVRNNVSSFTRTLRIVTMTTEGPLVVLALVTYHHNLLVGFGREGHRTAVGHFVSLQNPSKSLFSVAICSQ